MAARVRCPDCDTVFAPPARAPKFRCPSCGSSLLADTEPPDDRPRSRRRDEDDYDDRPRARRRDDDDYDDRPRPRRRARRDDDDNGNSGGQKGVLIAVAIGGSAFVLLAVVFGLYFALRTKGPAPAPEVAQAEAAGPRPAVRPFNPANPPAPPARPPGSTRPPAPPGSLAAPARWSATPDPATPADLGPPTKWSVPLPIGTQPMFPSTPSPFFAVGRNLIDKDARTLYDARTGHPAGAISGRLTLYDPLSLSPDGKHLAGIGNLATRAIDVWGFADGQLVRSIAGEKAGGIVNWLDFGPRGDEVLVAVDDFMAPTLQVWSFTTGQKVASFPLPKSARKGTFTLSPGRRLLALTDDAAVWVFDLSTGQPVGSRPFPSAGGPDRPISTTCGGLAFSPDGAELAGLIGGVQQGTRLVGWSVATGDQTRDHDLTAVVRAPGGAPPGHSELEYTPDGQAWVVQDNFVIERESGALLTRLQGPAKTGTGRLRLLPNDLLVVGGGTGARQELLGIPFNRPSYEAALKAARSAGTTAGSPPVAPDRSAVKAVAAIGSPAWAVTADPAPARKSPLAAAPLSGAPGAVRAIVFAAPEAGRAASLSVTEVATPFLRNVLTWNRCDLTAGRLAGTVELGTVKPDKALRPVVAALGPSGGMLAVRSPGDPKRVDVWSEEGKLLFGFLPAAGGEPVEWIGFPTDDRLLTLAGGRLTLWEVPGCKAVYETAAGYAGTPAFSPGRKWLVAYSGTGFDVLDAATGECRGRLVAGPPGEVEGGPAAAFTPDGTRLAVVVPATARRQAVVVCDVATGKPAAPFEVAAGLPGSTPGALQWCGPRHLLLAGSWLIDLDLKAAVWQYSPTGLTANGSPDGRVWHSRSGGGGAKGAGVITGAVLPDPRADQTLASAKAPGVERVIGPGAAVSIRLNLSGPPGDATFTAGLKERLTRQLERAGLVVRDGSPLTLSVNASETNSGDTMEVTRFGGGGGGKRSFPVPKITATAALTDAGGREVWAEKREFGHGRILTRFFNGNEEPEKVLAGERWNSCAGWVEGVRLPPLAYRVGGQLVTLPGSSMLGLDR